MLPSFVELSLVFNDDKRVDDIDAQQDDSIDESLRAFPHWGLTQPVAQEVVRRGSVAFSVMVTTGRTVDFLQELMVDLDHAHSTVTYGGLRSLIGDSWIMTSSALTSYTGKLDVSTAVIRAAVMLIAKRIWKIQQFAPVREAIVLMHFAALGGKLIADRNQPLSDALIEISAIPIMVYTAIAEVIRNTGMRLRQVLHTHLMQNIHIPLPPPPRAYNSISDLEQDWTRSVPFATRRTLRGFRRSTNYNDNLIEWNEFLLKP